MASLNKVFLMGNLTRDPELRYTPAGLAVASFGIAINSAWTAKSGEKKEEVCYVDINIFGRRAEVVGEYFSKGNPIFIEGRLQYNQWETKDGQKRNTLRVVADNFQFIGGLTKRPEEGAGVSSKEGKQSGDVPEDVNLDINHEDIPF
ncbi:MAG: single-stranded DNA-binding protein [Candidatus Jettenia sp.]|uniref:Single-stranded DNA-binding protein n=1 Tax=Candidatus Jettenia caeni TaxID=247490 RepID=I3II60_9BACT|nr:single-stranded DNA-binding protein [Candidatus Jettenia sp. AMX1]MBC6929251.1 single-stranded DNA-binding protein [Candidatus Jettenia sp.]NUN22373.1 single-stranded DNA-binding protein [Candidatus Jettenia caeni]KAA0250987.1 MAG: single-stranded DNA-binding protein [Candidatus Jettenia sp. AMX1]MCE7880220.1 single-stranded DNA-binding protein [Candidatus Jettenia sp. AMX1]MCQ3926356.1 single-stranded DNA-binding protein [Candidatus Jettenia sp.]